MRSSSETGDLNKDFKNKNLGSSFWYNPSPNKLDLHYHFDRNRFPQFSRNVSTVQSTSQSRLGVPWRGDGMIFTSRHGVLKCWRTERTSMILSGLPVISLCNTWGLLVVNGVKLSVGIITSKLTGGVPVYLAIMRPKVASVGHCHICFNLREKRKKNAAFGMKAIFPTNPHL